MVSANSGYGTYIPKAIREKPLNNIIMIVSLVQLIHYNINNSKKMIGKNKPNTHKGY